MRVAQLLSEARIPVKLSLHLLLELSIQQPLSKALFALFFTLSLSKLFLGLGPFLLLILELSQKLFFHELLLLAGIDDV